MKEMKEIKEMKDELRQLNHKYADLDWYEQFQMGLDLKEQLEDDLVPKLEEQLYWQLINQLLNQLDQRLHWQLCNQLRDKYNGN